MRKIIFLGIIVFVCGCFNRIAAQGIRFSATYEEAQQEARKQDKLLFVDFYTEWCGPCKILAKNVFPLKEAGDYFNRHFVAVQVDAEKEGRELAEKYEISAYPTMVFLNADGEIVNKIVGSVDVQKLIRAGEKALQLRNDPNSLFNLKKQYAGKRDDARFLESYIAQMKKFGEPPYQAIEDFLKVQTAWKGTSSRMMEFLMENANYLMLGGEAERIFSENEERYMKMCTQQEEKKIESIFSKMLYLTEHYAVDHKDVELYKIFLDRWQKLEEKPYYHDYNALKLELLRLEDEMKAYRKQAFVYLDSVVDSRTVEDIHAKDQERYDEYCEKNPRRGMFADIMRESYKNLDASLQVVAIVKVGSQLLDVVKKSDFKRFDKWIAHGKALLPESYVIPNFEANVLYKRGRKEDAVIAKTKALSLVPKGHRASLDIGKELEMMKNNTFVNGVIIER